MKLNQSLISVCSMIYLTVCLMFITGNAQAEIKPGAITISPSIGGYLFENKENFEDDNMVYGLGLGYYYDEHWGVEAVFNYIDTKIELGSNERDVDVYLNHIDVLYHFMPYSELVPYIAAGAGVIVFDPDDTHTKKSRRQSQKSCKDAIVFDPDDAHTDNDFAANYGVGLKYAMTENVSLRADVRHVICIDDSTQNNLLYTAGLTIAFGGKTAKERTSTVEYSEKADNKVVLLASESEFEKKVAVAATEEDVVILAFEDVHFNFDKSTLTPEAQMILKRNIQILKDNPQAEVRIAGYTSASGTYQYNQELSERRASAVREYLISEGIITPERLSQIGYGKSNPAMYEKAPKEIYSEAAKANMRVLFEIIVK
ncbi:MAG: OmpA family protein [Desulfamplus sp.]|nr:OmpA family protein [Desulfamplus sp.]